MDLFAPLLALASILAVPAYAQVPATCVVSGTVLNGLSQPVPNANVRIRTVSPTAVGNYGITTNDLTAITDGSGNWSLTVIAGLKAQVDIPSVGIANDIIVPSVGSCPVSFGSLTLYSRGTQTPATIISTAGPSMGGDLTGTSPNPSVIALRGQALAAGNCTNGQARVYSSGSSSYTCQTVTAGTSVTSISAGTGIAVTGTASVPIVGLSAGGVTSTQLGAGAAATNLGAAGGALAGTYPSPTLAAGVAVANVGALGGDLSGALPSPSVATVGAQTAANVAAGAVLANASTNANTPGTIVRRDGSGNFNIGTITGALTGNATTATTLSSTLTGDASSAGNAVTVTGLRGRPVNVAAPTTGYALTWSGTDWAPAAAVGTVTSVSASGGGTGMSFSGSPVVGAGTLTLQGTLNIVNGGTGAASANAGFNALSPMLTVGDLVYEGTGPVAARLAGNATITPMLLFSTGAAGLATAPAWRALLSGDVPASIAANTSGTAAGLSATLVVGSGGTGQTTAGAAFNALAPTTTTGDTIYANGAGTNARLGGNITTARQFLLSQGSGAASLAPSWTALVSGDIPNNAANTSGTAAGLSATLGVATGGTGAVTFSAGILHASGTSPFTSSLVALGSDVSGTLPIGSGGTGQTTASTAFNTLMPLTTLGDTLYASGANTAARLAGNITVTKQFLSETGNGATSAAPVWGALVAGDIPNLPAAILTSGTVALAQLPVLAGDTTGTITANTNVKLQGRTVAATGPTDLQYLGWNNGSTQWEPKTLPAGGVSTVSGSGGSTGLTLTGGPTGAVTLTLGGTLIVANGGTGLASGTSGGIPYFSGTTAMTSSGAFTANALLLGGGVGAAPAAMGSLGTTSTLLHGNAGGAPTFGQVNLATEVTGTLPIGNLGAGVVLANGTVPLTANLNAGNFAITAQNSEDAYQAAAYGVVANGSLTVSATGTDQSANFLTALTAAVTNGKKLKLPCGVIKFTGAILIPEVFGVTTNVHINIEGCGSPAALLSTAAGAAQAGGTILQFWTGAGIHGLRLETTNSLPLFTLRNVEIRGPDTDIAGNTVTTFTSGDGLHLVGGGGQATVRLDMENVSVNHWGGGKGISCVNCENGSARNIDASWNGTGISFSGAANANQLYNPNVQRNVTRAIEILDVDEVNIFGGLVQLNNKTGIYVNGSTNITLAGVHFENNNLSSTVGEYALNINGTNGHANTNVHVIGGIFNAANDKFGLTSDGVGTVAYSLIENCRFMNAAAGITIGSALVSNTYIVGSDSGTFTDSGTATTRLNTVSVTASSAGNALFGNNVTVKNILNIGGTAVTGVTPLTVVAGAAPGILDGAFIQNGDAGAPYAGEALYFGFAAGARATAASRIIGYQNPANVNSSRLLFQSHNNVGNATGYLNSLILDENGFTGLNLPAIGAANVQLDVNGAIATRTGTVAVVNGLNSNIALPAFSYVRLTGPSAAFSLGGFTGPTDGRLLTVYNTTAQPMTIVAEDLSSTAANRITLPNSATSQVLEAPGAATFIYDVTAARWIYSAPLETALETTPNGGQWLKGQSSELLTLSTVGATTDTTGNLLPANAVVKSVVVRVVASITVASAFTVGDATIAGRFLATGTGLGVGSTGVGLAHVDQTGTSGPRQTAAAKVRVTTTGTPGAGQLRLTVFYDQFVPPTS